MLSAPLTNHSVVRPPNTNSHTHLYGSQRGDNGGSPKPVGDEREVRQMALYRWLQQMRGPGVAKR